MFYISKCLRVHAVVCRLRFSAYIIHTVFCWFFTIVYTFLALLPIERIAVPTVVAPVVNVIAAAVLASVVADPAASPDYKVRLECFRTWGACHRLRGSASAHYSLVVERHSIRNDS